MITEDYCSYEVSKLLKEKGFDEETEDYYRKKDKSLEWASAWTRALPDEYYPCPTHQMAMKWLREVHHAIIVLKPATFSGEECTSWGCDIWCGDNFEKEIFPFVSYEDAVEAAIKYSLEIIRYETKDSVED